MIRNLNKNPVPTEDQGFLQFNNIPEIGGFSDKKLPEPTRYGDWEVGGRCSDF